MDLMEVLGFLFMLSTMELGRVRLDLLSAAPPLLILASVQDYSTENLGETQKAMLEDLRDYGLIWQRKAWRASVGLNAELTFFSALQAYISPVLSDAISHDAHVFIAPVADVHWHWRRDSVAGSGVHHS